MIQELIDIAKAQPFLVGGVGTTITASCLFLLRSIPSRISDMCSSALTSTLNVNTRNDYFNHIDHYIWKHRFKSMFKHYEPADRVEDDSYEEIVYLNPGYGSGWGMWNGVLFYFNKHKEEKGFELNKELFIRFWTRDVRKVTLFVDEAYKYQRGEPRQRVYVSAGTHWRRVADKRLRPLETVFVSGDRATTLINKIDFFLKNEDYYIKRGIPYKLVIMLYGPPGTGKTSLIHAAASHFGCDINYVTQLGSLGNLLGSRSSRANLVVVEDIDTLADLRRAGDSEDDFLTPAADPPREKNKQEQNNQPPNALFDLLQSTDGFQTAHKTIMVITSNHPERLDHALLRAGRIDLALEIGPLDYDAANAMFTAFYAEPFPQGVEEWYSSTIGAALQEIFMQHTEPSAAIAALKAVTDKKDSH